VADVVSVYLGRAAQLTRVDLWKDGGRLDGTTTDLVSLRRAVQAMGESGDFTHVNLSAGPPKEGKQSFSVQMNFSCEAPGQRSTCPAGSASSPESYSVEQVRAALLPTMGEASLIDVRLTGRKINLTARASGAEALKATVARIHELSGFIWVSSTSLGPARGGGGHELSAVLMLRCPSPPKAGGICEPG
jgi:hypothetical protein